MDIKMATSGWNFVGSEVGFLREKPRHDGWKKGFWTSKYQKCPESLLPTIMPGFFSEEAHF